MQCPHCQAPLAQLSKFCPKCGGPVGPATNGMHEVYVALGYQLAELKAAHEKTAAGLAAMERCLGGFHNALKRHVPDNARAPVPDAALAEPLDFSFEPGPGAPAQPAPDASRQYSSPQAARMPRPAPARPSSDADAALELKFGRNWLLIAGIVIMVFGIGYFLKYSFEQGWIGPALRVGLAYLWGLVFLGGGELFRRKGYRTYGLTVAGGGVAVLYFATFAGYKIYELIPVFPAFGLMALTTALAISLAVIYDVVALAALGLAGGFLTPVLLSSGVDRPVALMSYLALLNAGVLATAFKKRWTLLARLGFIATYTVYWAWYADHYEASKFAVALCFLNLFFVMYAILPLLYDLKGAQGGQGGQKGEPSKSGFIGIANGFIAFGFSYAMIEPLYGERWAALLSCGYAALYCGLAAWLLRLGLRGGAAFALMLGNAALYVSLAIPLLFSGHWITLFWALQAAALLWIGRRIERRLLALAGYCLLALSLGKFYMHDYDVVFHLHSSSQGLSAVFFQDGYGYRIVERYLNTLVLTAILGAFARLSQGRGLLGGPAEPGRGAAPMLYALLLAHLFIVLNIECNAFFYATLPPARTASLSALWTLFSASLIAAGFKLRVKGLRVAALSLFAATALKVVLVDMSQVATPYRIVSFILLGTVLVGASFLYHRFNERALPPAADKPHEVAP